MSGQGGGPSDTARFDLDRFVRAQDGVYDQALAELRSGRKTSHWMWFVFPQLVGLGSSPTAQRFGIDGLAEARAYLGHGVLGSRLVESSTVVLDAPAASAEALLGSIDVLKLRSSMTLFSIAADDSHPFDAVLERWYAGQRDARTLALLRT